jgi:hypothetical protein
MSQTPASGKKDQTVQREVLRELSEEIPQGRTEPHLRNPNRDQWRGDWDRSGRHTDEDENRAEF